MPTVKDVTFDLLRRLGVTTVVGNPGSTEETFLKNFPADFEYIQCLQEASVVGVADGLAQGLRKPVIVNVHTGAGLGNAMGCVITAYLNKTPLILTAGQQTRDMLLLEPLLTNISSTLLPQPWVKWSYEPARAQDVPAAFMRAYAAAVQPPAGRCSCRCRSTIGTRRWPRSTWPAAWRRGPPPTRRGLPNSPDASMPPGNR